MDELWFEIFNARIHQNAKAINLFALAAVANVSFLVL